MSIYLACLAFGAVMLLASLLGGHHGDGGHAGGDADAHGDAAHEGHAGLLPFLSLRFWIFAVTFFGLTGAVVSGLRLAPRGVAPFIAAAMAVACGYVAATVLQALGAQSVGRVADAASHLGREGRLTLPAARGQRGKVRLTLGGGHVDMIAETDGDQPLPAGTVVLVVGIRGTTAVVERSPAPQAPEPKESP